MHNPKIELAAGKIIVARDLPLSASALLISEGVDRWSVISHLEGALEDTLGSICDIDSKCDKGDCSPDH